MASIGWVHCNNCFHLMSKNNRKFYILNCNQKHVLCQTCMQKTENGKICPLCKQNIRFVQLNNEAPSSVKELFDAAAAKRAVQTYVRITEFQRNQRKNLVENSKLLENKYKMALEYSESLKKTNVDLTNKYEKAKNYRRTLQIEYKKMMNIEDNVENSSTLSTSSNTSFELNKKKENNQYNEPTLTGPYATYQFGLGSAVPLGVPFEKPEQLPIRSEREPPFFKQKASTPNLASQQKVFNAAFSFNSTASSVRRFQNN